ncbi:hypothetical protein EDD85DRAFT_445363 [Armillaria nabsnona]|nr:hypothetical protein EDD85DRAFT_445363 [Armillaria nabsnona]
MLAMPVVTLFSTNSNVLSDFIHSFDHSSRFTTIILDASSVEALSMGLKLMVHSIKANNSAHQPLLLVLENADPSLKLDQYFPHSFHNPILMTSTNQAVSCLASPACKFELPDSMDQQAADSLHRSIERAFASLQHIVTIVARGGTGKTQLVLNFVSKDTFRFIHVWFFDATSDATLAADFKKLGKAAGVGESVNDVQDFLRRMQEDWLLIFDNADDPKVELSKYIPQCNHGSIIITSRLTEVNQMASPGAHLDFYDLEQREAVNLLLKHAHEDFNNNNQQLASDIVDALGCQALAVATAGAYIASTATCTLSIYLSLFKQKSKQLLNYKMKSLDGYQKTVFSAFQLSFDQLSSSTQLFMQICAFFHHTDIPVELFYQAAAFTGYDLEPEEKEKTPAVEELKKFLSLFPHEWSWNDSIDELSQFSLTVYNTDAKALSFHPILYICIQETIVNKNEVYHIAQLLLARATPHSITDVTYQFQQLLLAHAINIDQNNLCTFGAYGSFGRIFEDAGLWEKAKHIYQKALEHCEHYFEKHHFNTLKSMSNLGNIYAKLGQLKEAKMLHTETLKLCKEVLGEHHPNTLSSMNNLALIYHELGQLEEAKVLHIETLKLHKEVLGEHHFDTLTSINNLALIYHELGQLEEAKVLHTETLKLCKEVFGEHHSHTLSSMNNLALTYHVLGQLEEVKVLHTETLKLCKEVLGEHHPNTLSSMNNLALTYHVLGQLEEAKVLHTKTLKLRKKVFGEHHPDTLLSMNNLALIYHVLGQLEEAKVLHIETLKLRKEVLGEHHPNTLSSMNNLALIYHMLGQLEEAKVLHTETLKLRKEVLGEYHPNTLSSMSNLALTYKQLGQLEEAKVLDIKTLKLRKEVLGEHHPNTLSSMSNLALTYKQLGQLEEAKVLQSTLK